MAPDQARAIHGPSPASTNERRRDRGAGKSSCDKPLPLQEGSMHGTPINSAGILREASPAKVLAFPGEQHADAETIVGRLLDLGVVKPDSPAATHLRSIFRAPPEALRVSRIARRVYVARRTLGRHFQVAG